MDVGSVGAGSSYVPPSDPSELGGGGSAGSVGPADGAGSGGDGAVSGDGLGTGSTGTGYSMQDTFDPGSQALAARGGTPSQGKTDPKSGGSDSGDPDIEGTYKHKEESCTYNPDGTKKECKSSETEVGIKMRIKPVVDAIGEWVGGAVKWIKGLFGGKK
jgi:hypothetical protein